MTTRKPHRTVTLASPGTASTAAGEAAAVVPARDLEAAMAAYNELYDAAEGWVTELRETLDMLHASMTQAAERGTRIAQLEAELTAARDVATSLFRTVTVHGACPDIADDAYALEGTVRICADCGAQWAATGLDVEVATSLDGDVAADARTSWTLLTGTD